MLPAQDMQSIMSAAVMRWWPDQMVPMHRPNQAVADAKAQWEAMHLYEPFEITHQLASKYSAPSPAAVSASERKRDLLLNERTLSKSAVFL